MMSIDSKLAKRLVWGCLWGVGMATWFSLIACVIYTVAGQQHRVMPTPLAVAIASYFVAGIAAGMVVGLLRPLGQWWWGAALIGTLAALIAGIVGGVAVGGGFTGWDAGDLANAALYALLVGPTAGILIRRWYRHHVQPRRKFGEGWYE
jgi:hypothetical protein